MSEIFFSVVFNQKIEGGGEGGIIIVSFPIET